MIIFLLLGDSRAILVKKDKNTNQIDVLQLSVDHDLKNEDELLRLSHLGLDVDQLRQCSKLGNQDNTRCIGNYQVKGGYKDFEMLCAAESEPVIAEPEIIGGIPIDDNCLFLLLMSDGFYKTLETVGSPSQDTNAEIAKVVIEQFSLQSTLAGVAQGAVDKVVRFHHDQYMNSCSLSSKSRNFEDYRDDITLLVRNFNMSLPNMRSVRMGGLTPTGRPDPLSQSLNKNLDSSSADATDNDTERTFSGEDSLTFSSTQNSTNLQETFPSQNLSEALSVDENGHLPAYVDFSEYYKAVAEAEQQGKNVFDDADLVEGWKNDECGVIME
ncbi:TGF-beta-activated kinase 1 and MAP3K7-binding protein 1 [Nymphon striatum]|nr:TGF-beta-activated kinase 1 and MAP3K7-binding protein 1 [Nymphon striatum]